MTRSDVLDDVPEREELSADGEFPSSDVRGPNAVIPPSALLPFAPVSQGWRAINPGSKGWTTKPRSKGWTP